jgi:hypothetical protein
MMNDDERRREKRVQIKDSRFLIEDILKYDDEESTVALKLSEPIRCSVMNVSRLGIGVELPVGGQSEVCQNIQTGAELVGCFFYAGTEYRSQSVVRVRRDNFLGLEYISPSPEFLRGLKAILRPRYVAASIHAIAPEHLGAHIRAVYQSDDFECIIFKPGISGAKTMIQVLWKGKVVEIVDDKPRFVPALLVREGTTDMSGANLVKSFSNLPDEGTKRQLEEFFRSLSKVFQAWETCPLELQAMIRKQLVGKS